jgi:hypothetical protein
VKFNPMIENVFEKVFNFQSDTFVIALTAAANTPTSSNSQLSNLTQVSYTNLSSRTLTVSSSAQSGGTYKWVLADLTLTASGGSVAAFQNIVIYDDTAANDELVGYYSYGSDLTLANGESLLLDFDGSNGVIQAS